MREVLNREEFSSAVRETGYRKALSMVQVNSDRDDLALTLCQYFTIARGQLELEQFTDGLKAFALLDMMRQHPRLFKPLFTACEGTQLDKGVLHTSTPVR